MYLVSNLTGDQIEGPRAHLLFLTPDSCDMNMNEAVGRAERGSEDTPGLSPPNRPLDVSSLSCSQPIIPSSFFSVGGCVGRGQEPQELPMYGDFELDTRYSRRVVLL